MKRFTITHLLLFVTWCAIAFVFLSRYLASAPYQGDTYDIDLISRYGFGETAEAIIVEQAVNASPAWHPADPNPPMSARSALSIAERLCRERLRDKNNWKWGLESLALYPLDGKNNKWCWSVNFTAYPESGVLSGIPPRYNEVVRFLSLVFHWVCAEHW